MMTIPEDVLKCQQKTTVLFWREQIIYGIRLYSKHRKSKYRAMFIQHPVSALLKITQNAAQQVE